MTYRRLVEADRASVHRFRTEAEAWLASKGIDQYQSNPMAHEQIDEVFDQGRFVGLEYEGELVAVAAWVDPDPRFWSEGDQQQRAHYFGRLMTSGRHHGRGYGARLISHMAAEALGAGSAYLRLDCWRTNYELHNFYRQLGFDHVRTVERADTDSGTLFQLRLQHFSTHERGH